MGQAPCAKGGQVGRRDRTAAPLTEAPAAGGGGRRRASAKAGSAREVAGSRGGAFSAHSGLQERLLRSGAGESSPRHGRS